VPPAARCRLLALFGPRAMSDLSPECAPERTSADRSEFMGSRPGTPSLRGAPCPPWLNERRRKRRSNPFFHCARDGLLRGACHRAALRADPLAGKDGCPCDPIARRANHLRVFAHGESSPLAENIPLSPSGKSVVSLRPSHPTRGAARDRHETRGGMRWTRMCL
jgi:hypothetical protein